MCRHDWESIFERLLILVDHAKRSFYILKAIVKLMALQLHLHTQSNI